MESFFLSPVRLPKNDAVPDLAMVPIFSMTSVSLIPIPLSEMTILFSAGITLTETTKSDLSSSKLSSAKALNLNLSNASDALETSSLIKISLFEYKE